MTPRRWLSGGLLATVLAGAACDATDEPARLPDAEVAPEPMACEESVTASDRFAIRRCADRARLSLVVLGVDGPRETLDCLGPAVEIDGVVFDPTDWTTVVWRPEPQGLTVDWRGHARAPDITMTLRFDGPCVTGRTALAGAGVTVDAAHALHQTGADARLEGLGRWTLAPGVEPWADGSPPDPGPRVFAGTDRAIALGAIDPLHPLWTEVTTPAPTPRLRAIRRGPLRIDGEVSIGWALCAADDAVSAVDALGARLEATPAPAPAPRLALRADAGDPAPALRRVADVGAFGHIWLTGDWWLDRADWRPTPAVAALPEAAAPATVGVQWPLLSVPADAPFVLDNPHWLDADCAPACPRLDPRIPEVREHLARRRLALAAAGLEVRLTGIEHLDPADLRPLLAALDIGAAVAPSIAPPAVRTAPPAELGLSPSIPIADADSDPALTLARWLPLAAGARVEPAIDLALDAPSAAARRALALALIAGYGALDVDGAPADIEPLVAYWQQATAPDIARPLPGRWFTEPPLPAPPDWRATDRLILLNPTASTRTVTHPIELAPDLPAARSLLHPDLPPLGQIDAIDIPPGDAVVWATVDGGPSAE